MMGTSSAFSEEGRSGDQGNYAGKESGAARARQDELNSRGLSKAAGKPRRSETQLSQQSSRVSAASRVYWARTKIKGKRRPS